MAGLSCMQVDQTRSMPGDAAGRLSDELHRFGQGGGLDEGEAGDGQRGAHECGPVSVSMGAASWFRTCTGMPAGAHSARLPFFLVI